MTKEKEQSKDDEVSTILSDFFQFYIILLLSEGPNHGYGLIKAFKERTGRNLSAGTLYPFLHKLQEKGIVSQTDKPVGKKPRTIYSLTRKGRKFCDRLFSRFAAITASAIEPRLETCASCGVRIYEGGYHEVIDGQEMAFCCVHCAAAYKKEGESHNHAHHEH